LYKFPKCTEIGGLAQTSRPDANATWCLYEWRWRAATILGKTLDHFRWWLSIPARFKVIFLVRGQRHCRPIYDLSGASFDFNKIPEWITLLGNLHEFAENVCPKTMQLISCISLKQQHWMLNDPCPAACVNIFSIEL